MESLVMVLYVAAAIAGLVALEMRQARASVAALGAAFILVAIAMFVLGAVEVGVGVVVAGVVLVAVFSWGFRRTVQSDALPALQSGASGVLAIVTVVLFAIVVFVAARPLLGGSGFGAGAPHTGSSVGLLREAIVIVAALAAVWAMLRKSGRRDE
jgi:hypothetical protein